MAAAAEVAAGMASKVPALAAAAVVVVVVAGRNDVAARASSASNSTLFDLAGYRTSCIDITSPASAVDRVSTCSVLRR